jgi:hypothetical protein
MPLLFAGQLFSEVMKDRLSQMKSEIEKLKCSDVIRLGTDELSTIAGKYADKYVATDLPQLDLPAMQKGIYEDGDAYWKLPFVGGSVYFGYAPSKGVFEHSVDKIEGNCIFIRIGKTSGTEVSEGAEQRAQSTIALMEKAIASMRHDSEANFSKETFNTLALHTIETKRASCAKLIAAGYSVR